MYGKATSQETTNCGDQMTRSDLAIDDVGDGVARIEICRPPHNFFDTSLIEGIVEAIAKLTTEGRTRSVVLTAQGKNFCAGADFTGASGARAVSADEGAKALYGAAAQLFASELPIVAAVQGAAIGGGLGLALAADFRVASAQSRFSANFSRLGLHHGFGLTTTLPRVVGHQYASDLLLTGRRIDGVEAHRIGLIDRLVDSDQIVSAAIALAAELATAAPLALKSIRATLRHGLVSELTSATEHERSEQAWLRQTSDFSEGVRAAAERRAPVFTAR
jgi:enoyl-CoA hydratase/carnithine racemase